MAKSRQAKKPPSGNRNSERRNGKAFKKNPGVAPKAHSGKSVGGYAKFKRYVPILEEDEK